MAKRAIREYDAKRLLAQYLPDYLTGFAYSGQVALMTEDTNWKQLVVDHPWLETERLVVKPDQLFGKRGKHGLLGLNLELVDVQDWVRERMDVTTTVGRTTDKLTTFLIEPFVPHDQKDELFVAIRTERDGDTIYFSLQGGINIEENWDSVVQIQVPILAKIDDIDVAGQLPDFPGKDQVARFIVALYKFFVDLGFVYLEINPFALVGDEIVPLDFVARVDDTAAFEAGRKWGELPFPPAFGTHMTPAEEYIHSLDEKTGASLKLTILNPQGRVWPMVAGGGASVIYADTVADLGFAKELGCYGEYSGNPNTDETREYARTILDLMTREPDPQGRPKFLLIGGGIANFTDVAKTFTGIVQALREYKLKLQQNHVKIYVRRGGPNYQEGLAMMRRLGKELDIPIEVYGPETHMTRIVSMALAE
ncbi:MAG: ATPase [Chloroflexi bacterium]|nr:ATPase [Chloroflexota bacterium]MBU1750636.1 ATPase [Chloroflexota bacterium]MBU1879150.1 ATPase [Chloroflexota bacterium]